MRCRVVAEIPDRYGRWDKPGKQERLASLEPNGITDNMLDIARLVSSLMTTTGAK